MQILRTAITGALVLLATACGSTGPDVSDILVEASTKEGVTLDGRTTYAWGGGVKSFIDPDAKWTEPHPDVLAAITRITDANMEAKGLTEVEESPALLVYYGVGVDMAVMNIIDGKGDDHMRIDPMVKVGMCLLLVDAATDERIWVSVASGDIDWSPTEQNTSKRIEYAIGQMFKKFPE